MTFLSKVKDIRTVIEKNKLVAFVGSGVSQNSGIPTWSGLIKEFAIKLHYDNCNGCQDKTKGCKSRECKKRFSFNQDEFLRIPQYYFNSDKSRNHNKYYKLIRDVLESNMGSNPLNDMIIGLLPKHIITTNYDDLLEKSKNPNVLLYDVIVEDKDLLTHNSNNYIVKMHGDLSKPQTIVLKEEDYLNYQQEHILIETFIKSLLIDHTFLFIGYSLNDNNLKLIMSWIEYLAKQHAVKENRPRNYIVQVQDTPIDKYTEQYFESNNIFILSTYDLPVEIKDKWINLSLPDPGKKVYAMLDYISDDKNDQLLEPLSGILYEKYKIFDAFKRISYEDLLNVYSFGAIENIRGILLFYMEEEFRKLKPIIESNENNENYIKKTLYKAGITAIQYQEDFIEFGNTINAARTIDDELFDLFLNNEYLKIFAKLDETKDDNLIAYYYYLLMPNMGNLNLKLDEIELKNIYRDNLYNLVIYKYNCIGFKLMTFQEIENDWREFQRIINNIPSQYKKAYRFMEKLHNNMIENRFKFIQIFESHERQFTKKDNSVTFGMPMRNLYQLQSYAYDYYYYIKYNNIMLDYFTNPKTYFELYIKAILCTYSSLKERHTDNYLGLSQSLGEYKLNSIDLDMLIKHVDNKLLKSWALDYKIKRIEFEDEVDVMGKFANLCNSLKIFGNTFSFAHLSNYLFIITKLIVSDEDKEKIITVLGDLIRDDDKPNGLIIQIFDDLEYFIQFYQDENIVSFYDILCALLKGKLIKVIEERFPERLCNVFKSLIKYTNTQVHEIIDRLINDQDSTLDKLNMIYILHHLFSESQKLIYTQLIKNNINLIASPRLFRYAVDGDIDLDEIAKQRFMNIIEKEIKMKEAQPGFSTYPDWLTITLDYCINLHLLGKWEKIDDLQSFTAYSDHLSFILDSNTFDYSKIDTNNYMWLNLFRSKTYQDILILHKNQIFSLDLKKAMENGYASDAQKKLLYRYLLSDKELWIS